MIILKGLNFVFFFSIKKQIKNKKLNNMYKGNNLFNVNEFIFKSVLSFIVFKLNVMNSKNGINNTKSTNVIRIILSLLENICMITKNLRTSALFVQLIPQKLHCFPYEIGHQ